MKTIQEYRQNGWKVRVSHFRLAEKGFIAPKWIIKKNGLKLTNNGGMTEIAATNSSGKTYYASANCSLKDIYCYKTGVKVALERLEKEISKV